MSPDRALNIAELAELLGVPRSWVRDKVTARELPHHRIGRHVRFFADDIAAIKQQTAAPATAGPAVQLRRKPRRIA
jgi:excisionase family DNA binding protein